jgi:hypothetical protein
MLFAAASCKHGLLWGLVLYGVHSVVWWEHPITRSAQSCIPWSDAASGGTAPKPCLYLKDTYTANCTARKPLVRFNTAVARDHAPQSRRLGHRKQPHGWFGGPTASGLSYPVDACYCSVDPHNRNATVLLARLEVSLADCFLTANINTTPS